MSDRRGNSLLRRLNGQEGFGLLEALAVGVVAGTIFVAGGKAFWDWAVTETQQQKPPPNLGTGPAPLLPPPSDRDEECVRNAYESQGLIFDAGGDPARFEAPHGGMWFIAGIVSGPGSVYTAREVEAKVKYRYFLAQKRWTRDCEKTTQDELPSLPRPPSDLRQLYYGTYRLTWIDKTGTAAGACPELNMLPPTLTAGSPGESIGGVIITFGGKPPVKASLGGDRFNTPGEAESAGVASQLSGTFVERGGRIEIESGYYEFFQENTSTSLCRISFTGIK